MSEKFQQSKPIPHLPARHDKLIPNKQPQKLPPPLTGFAATGEAGVSGEAFIPKQAGVFAFHIEGNALFADSPKGIALHARGATLAGFFEGDVQVMGNINLIGPNCDITLQNEDCAEQFNLSDTAVGEPGMVMVIDDSGLLRPSEIAYDRRVAGVVSGAGDFKPAMMLGVKPSSHRRTAIALLGKVYCRVDADVCSIEVGDLLTSSSVTGHAMAATESGRAFGAIIGKALAPLASGRGLIPILVALQ